MSNPYAVNRGFGPKSHGKHGALTQQGYQQVNSSDPDVGRIGDSKVFQSESNRASSNHDQSLHATDHTLPFHGASKTPPHLHERKLSVEEPNSERTRSEDTLGEDILRDVASRGSSFSEEQVQHLDHSPTISDALVSTKGRTQSLQHGIQVVSGSTNHFSEEDIEEIDTDDFRTSSSPSSFDHQPKPTLSLEEQNRIFLETFVFTPNDENLNKTIVLLNRASPEELFEFTTAFNTAIDSLLASPEKEKLFESELPFQKISLIMERALRREQEIFALDSSLREIQKNVSNIASSKLFQELEKSYSLSGGTGANNLALARNNLEATFKNLILAHQQHTAQKATFAQAATLNPEVKEQLENRIVTIQENSSTALVLTSGEKGEVKNRAFSFEKEDEFNEVAKSLYHQETKKSLFYFHTTFATAAVGGDRQGDPAYNALLFLNQKIKVMNLQEEEASAEKAAPPASNVEKESGWMDWLWSPIQTAKKILGYNVGNAEEPLSAEEIESKLPVEQQRIETILANKTSLSEIKRGNPEKPVVDFLGTLQEQDPDLIIINKTTSAEQPEEKKSRWGIVRFYRWLTSTGDEINKAKARYQGGIMAARNDVEAKYGPYAAKRFDAHFALRYRTGSPLTMRALTQFIAHEEKLLGQYAPQGSQGVVTLDLAKVSSVGDVSIALLAAAEKEFNQKYYEYDEKTGDYQRPAGMDLISKEDEAVLFADFYQNYLKRPVVITNQNIEVSNKVKGGEGLFGFFSTRFNALWTSTFPGNNNRENKDAKKNLMKWMEEKLSVNGVTTGFLASKDEIKELIKLKLKRDNKLTLGDLDEITVTAQLKSDQNNTWANFWWYRIYAPATNTAANAVGVAAGGRMLVNAQYGSAALLAGANFFLGGNKPGVRLTTNIAGLVCSGNTDAYEKVKSGIEAVAGIGCFAFPHVGIPLYAGINALKYLKIW